MTHLVMLESLVATYVCQPNSPETTKTNKNGGPTKKGLTAPLRRLELFAALPGLGERRPLVI